MTKYFREPALREEGIALAYQFKSVTPIMLGTRRWDSVIHNVAAKKERREDPDRGQRKMWLLRTHPLETYFSSSPPINVVIL